MYVIIVYDVDVSRVNKVKAFLRQHLNWVQNSVFEGETTPARLEKIKLDLKKLISEQDSVIIYKFRDKKAMKREVIGVEKMELRDVI